VKTHCNSLFFVLLSTVSYFNMLLTLLLTQLFYHKFFICAVIDRQDDWCSGEFIFKMLKRRADETNFVLL